ncbi:MAG: hypothetical protein GZ088_14985 [Acidipila sp.]|nr:hypothetical protein [Acidipila sp.]
MSTETTAQGNNRRAEVGQRRLRRSGILLILGLLVETFSLVWSRPVAFIVFVGIGGLLMAVGILLYLFSLLPSRSAYR